MMPGEQESFRRASDAERLVKMETQTISIFADVEEVKHDVKELHDKFDTFKEQFAKRPSWVVVAFLTASTSLNVGLVVALTKR